MISENHTINDFTAGLTNGKLGAYATNPDYVREVNSMFKGVKNDYLRWFDNSIRYLTNTINVMKGMARSGLESNYQDSLLETIQGAFIERSKFSVEKEKVEKTK